MANDTRIKEGIKPLLERAESLLHTVRTLEEFSRFGEIKKIEREITERFAEILTPLIRLVEGNESEITKAIKESGLTDSEQDTLLRIRASYLPFKSAVQRAHAYEQGYINRITGVRYRPIHFLLGNVPALDVTLRSFDSSAFRVADTLDNVMGMAAGILQGIALAAERLRVLEINVPNETSKRLFEHVDKAMAALISVKRLQQVSEENSKPKPPDVEREEKRKLAKKREH